MEQLFEQITKYVDFEYDIETSQYCLVNDKTPGIYGIGDTKEEAIKEYLASLGDLILINEKKKNDIKAFA